MNLLRDQIVDGKYRILRTLGEGSMGAVYLAENMRIQRQVALKVLHADLLEGRGATSRFQHEAQITARVGSAHIVEVFDMGELPDGNCYLVMEYLEGETLGARLEGRTRLSADEATAVVAQMLAGLARAHQAHVVHRDIKPENVYLARREGGDFVKLLDFGVSKLLADAPRRAPHMTMDGTVVGTPQYMSPEQARGKEVDARSDLYSVGVVLYECLSGAPPFVGSSVQDVLFRVALEDAPALDAAALGLDAELVAIVSRAMAREVDARFPPAEAFGEALRAYREPRGFTRVLESGRPAASISVSPSSIAVTLAPPSVASTDLDDGSSREMRGARGDGSAATSTTAAIAVSTADSSARRAALHADAASTMVSAGFVTPRPAIWPRALASASLAFALVAAIWSYRSATPTSPPSTRAAAALSPTAESTPTPSPIAEEGAAKATPPSEKGAEPSTDRTHRTAIRPATSHAALAPSKPSAIAIATASAGVVEGIGETAPPAPATSAQVAAVPIATTVPAAASIAQLEAAAAIPEVPASETVAAPAGARPAVEKPSAKTIRGRKYRADL